MADRSNGINWAGLFNFFGVLLILAGIGTIAYLTYRGVEDIRNPTPINQTIVIQNQTVIHDTTIQQSKGFSFLDVFLLVLLFIAIIIIIILVLKKPMMKKIDVAEIEEHVFWRLLERGERFYDANGREISHFSMQKKRWINAQSWVLQDQIYFQKRDMRFKRLAIRFWRYPKTEELMTINNFDPNINDVICVTVNVYDIFGQWDHPGSMTFKEFLKYIHDQEYGFKPSPEPVEAENIFEIRRLKSIKDVEEQVFKDTVKEGMQQ